jgi:Domain of unknown function (DUF6285)
MLIAECERVIRDRLLPQADGDTRYQLLMIASALGMAARELAAGAALDAALAGPARTGGTADAAALVEALRRGDHDGSATLYEALQASAEAALAVANPKKRRAPAR